MAIKQHLFFFLGRLVDKAKQEAVMFLIFTGGYLAVLAYLYFTGPHSDGAFIFLSFFYCLFVVFIVLDGVFQRTSLTGYRMSPLSAKLGLQLEQHNKYSGYKGVYRGYFIRVYFRDQAAYPSLADELNIIVYYKVPGTETAEETKEHITRDYLRWRQIVSKVIVIPQITVEDICIRRQEAFGYIWTFNEIKSKIDYMISIAEKEGLRVLSEPEVKALIEENSEYAPFGFKKEFET